MATHILPCHDYGHKDAFVRSADPNANFGGWTTIAAGAGLVLTDLWRSFVEIPIISMPPGAVITNAVLRLYCRVQDSPIAYNVYMHEVLAPWNAGTVTWNTMPAVAALPEDTVLITGINTFFSWDITALVQAWYAGTKVNNGVCFIGEELIVKSYKQFWASEQHVVTPLLYITYTAFADLTDLDAFFYTQDGSDFDCIFKIRKDDGSLTEGWLVDNVYAAEGLSVNNTGRLYAVREQNLLTTTLKYEPDGTVSWSTPHGPDHLERPLSCAVNIGGRLVTGGNISGGLTTKVYNAAGVLEWSANHGAWVWYVALDNHDRVYTGGLPDIAGIGYRKYEADGAPAWTILDDNGYCIVVDANEYAYIISGAWGADVSKYRPDGTLVWTRQHGGWMDFIAVDAVGHAFILGWEAVGDGGGPADGMAFRKLETDGTILWSVAADGCEQGAPDPNGDIYLSILWHGDFHTAKFDSTGALVWEDMFGFFPIGWVWPWAVAVAPGLAGAGFWPAPLVVTQNIQVMVIS